MLGKHVQAELEYAVSIPAMNSGPNLLFLLQDHDPDKHAGDDGVSRWRQTGHAWLGFWHELSERDAGLIIWFLCKQKLNCYMFSHCSMKCFQIFTENGIKGEIYFG